MKRTLLSLAVAVCNLATGWAQTPQLDKVTPYTVQQGKTLELTVSGLNTSFESDFNFNSLLSLTQSIRISPLGSSSSYNGRIEVEQVVVDDDETLTLQVRVPNDASVTTYRLSTSESKERTYEDCDYYWNGERYISNCYERTYTSWETKHSLYPAFEVTPAPGNPYLKEVSPKEVTQGETLELTISGVNTDFKSYSSFTRALDIYSLGYDEFEIHHAFASDDETIKAYVTVPENTPVGPGFIETNKPYRYSYWNYDYWEEDLTLYPAFNIKAKAGSPQIKEVTPNKVEPGETLTLTVSGLNTNFNILKGFTSYTHSIPVGVYSLYSLFNAYSSTQEIRINDVQVINAEELEVNISVPENATTEAYGLFIINEGNYNNFTSIYPAFEVGDLAWLDKKTNISTENNNNTDEVNEISDEEPLKDSEQSYITSLDDEISNKQFLAYPTITQGDIQLEFNLPNAAKLQVKAFGLNGQYLGTFMNTNLEAGNYNTAINLAGLQAQTVVLGVFADEKILYNTKVIKQ